MLLNNALNIHGNYYTIPNAVLALGLSPGAIAVYNYLSFRECRRRGDKDHYTCHPSMATIGEAIGRSARSVRGYVQELVEAGLILTEPTKVMTADGMRWNGNLKYTLLDPQCAVELHHERQLAQLDAGVRKKRKAMVKAEKNRQRKQKPHDEYVAKRSANTPEELPF